MQILYHLKSYHEMSEAATNGGETEGSSIKSSSQQEVGFIRKIKT